MRKRTKIAAGILSLSILGISGVYGYFSDTLQVVNYISVGDIKISVEEFEKKGTKEVLYNNKGDVLPGAVVSKIPRITNRALPCWVRARILYTNDRKELEGLDTEMSLKGHAAATEEQSTKGESSSKDTWKQRKPKLKFTYKEQREFETIDDDIAKLEEKLETLDAQIAANATNSVKLRELMDKKEEAGNELDEKMERWVYLNDLNEKIQNADITKE